MVIQDNIINNLITMTSAVLSLIGLISIFISLSTEHKVNRARELLWEMQIAPALFQVDNNTIQPTNLIKSLLFYNSIVSTSKEFTYTVIRIAQGSIFIVALIWTSAMAFMLKSSPHIEKIYAYFSLLIIIVILLLVFYILGRLSDVAKIAQLPSGDKLLNLSFPIDSLNRLWIIARTMQISIKDRFDSEDNNTLFDFNANFFLPFYNYNFNININFRSKEPFNGKTLDENTSYVQCQDNLYKCLEINKQLFINQDELFANKLSGKHSIYFTSLEANELFKNWIPNAFSITISTDNKGEIVQAFFDISEELWTESKNNFEKHNVMQIDLYSQYISVIDFDWLALAS